MAATETNTRRRNGFRRTDSFWGCVIHAPRELLTAHGITQAEPFPGDPGYEAVRTIRTLDPAGRAIKIVRETKFRFAVYRDWDDAEKQAYEAREAEQKQIADDRRLVASWPASAAAYRDEAHEMLELLLPMVERVFSSGCAGGYRYDEDTAARVGILLGHIEQAVVEGTVVIDRSLREANTPRTVRAQVIGLDSAKRDRDFQRMLAGLNQGGGRD